MQKNHNIKKERLAKMTIPSDVLKKVENALKECRSELWQEWHSFTSVDEFNIDPLVEQIDEALTALRPYMEQLGQVSLQVGEITTQVTDDNNDTTTRA